MAVEALELMLALHRAPRLGSRLGARALPEDVLDVIRIAAGDERMTGDAEAATGLAAAQLREAAWLYLTHALFCDGADSYRTLGVNAQADARRIKEHHRWLIHWLHPDRGRGGDWSVFADSVNRAWNDLRTPERRQAYDLRQGVPLSPAATAAEGMPEVAAPVRGGAAEPDPLLSGRTVRRLPQWVLGVFGGIAALVVGLLIALNDPEQEPTVAPREAEQAAAANASAPVAVNMAAMPVPAEAQAGNVSPVPASVVDVAAGTASRAPSVAQAVLPADVMLDPGEPGTPAAALAPPAPDAAGTAAAVAVAVRTAARPATAPGAPALAASQASPPPRNTASAVAAAVPVADIASASDAAPRPATDDARPSGVPIAAAASPADAPATASPPVQAQAQATLARMQDAYRDGDLDLLMSLFVSEPAGRPRAVLEREYRELFAGSSARSLVLHDLVWLAAQDRLIGLGRFEAGVTPRRGSRSRVTRGGVRVELRVEQGQARIVRMSHESSDP